MANPLPIDIVSDVMCPWCYIGKRRLEAALALRPEVATTVRWRPFRLDPTIPREGVDRQDYLERKFGGRDNARALYAQIEAAGRDEGIAFAFDRIVRSPDTTDAHRLIRWAGEAGDQDAAVERLFQLYFLEGADIGDPEVLADVAADAGLDRDTVRTRLDGDADRDTVMADLATAQRLGINGVPCFIFAGKYAVMGAEAPENLASAIDQTLAARDGKPAA